VNDDDLVTGARELERLSSRSSGDPAAELQHDAAHGAGSGP
jgi:hypothetical protein